MLRSRECARLPSQEYATRLGGVHPECLVKIFQEQSENLVDDCWQVARASEAGRVLLRGAYPTQEEGQKRGCDVHHDAIQQFSNLPLRGHETLFNAFCTLAQHARLDYNSCAGHLSEGAHLLQWLLLPLTHADQS